MGLDNWIVYNLPKDGEVSLILKPEIVELFKRGEFLHRSEYSYCVTFCGKCYNMFFEEAIGFTLYKDLKPIECQEIYERLMEYVGELTAIFKKLIEIGEHYWIDREIINEWIYSFMEVEWMRHPLYGEMCEMIECFKICADNNLSIYASY